MRQRYIKVKDRVQDVADKCGVSRTLVYRMAQKIGRCPTIKEVQNRNSKRGRPRGTHNEKI